MTQLPPVRRPGMLVLQIVLAVVVFAAGVATGAGLYALYNDNRQDYYRKHPELAAVRFADRMSRPLDLAKNQQEQFRQIVQRHWPALQAVRAEVFPRMKVEMDNMREDLVSTLSPEQLKKWDEREAEFARSWAPTSQPASAP